MYRQITFLRVGLLAACLALSPPVWAENSSPAVSPSTISLAGRWHFQLDANAEGLKAEWFNQQLRDSLELPGSCEQRGFGIKPDKPEERRLTHVLKYVGPAWYQRDISIPPAWSNKRVELFLERCHWESTVWVDGRKIGTQNSLGTPHLYDLGELTPGLHKLTICIDNTYKIPIGTWVHAITEDTQGNWNGIIGRIELHATDTVWIRDIQVYPTTLKVSIGNETGQPIEAMIDSQNFHVPADGGDFELPFTRQGQPWNEFHPHLQQVTVTLLAGAFHDAKTVTYATRDLSTANQQFLVNGRPVLFRGAVDECVYPLTGYPPMDKASWLRVLRICQSYGFNFMRFHSWCPPEAAFAAADELGFYFQVELPLWTIDAPRFGKDAPRDQFIADELKRTLDTYGNHPSFALMAMGNESHGSLEKLVETGKSYDPRHLYRCEHGYGDYIEAGQRGILGPRTDWDRASLGGWMAGNEKKLSDTQNPPPILAHEIGQWEMYPDFDEIKKYTGTLRAFTYERYRESLAANHMLDQAKDFAKASGKFSVLLYKDEIEASQRTWPYGGFEILEARDYPGQGVAVVGWLDAFWDSKGLITPEEFRRFCGPTVCLLRMPRRVYTTADTFTAQAEISHFDPADLEANPDWSMADEHGGIIAEGKLPATKLVSGRLTSLGEISAALSQVAAPARLMVTLRAAGTSNSWNIWVYPATSPPPPANVVIAHQFDQAARDALAAGKRLLLFSSPTEGVIYPQRAFYAPASARILPEAREGANAIPGSFTPTCWNLQLFNQIGTLGILCDPQHPALAEFPTENHSDWQWADLLGNFSAANSFDAAYAPSTYAKQMRNIAGDVTNRSKAIILNETPADFRPIVQVIDNQERNAKLGSLFETRVGPGKLLVCAMDLDTDLDRRPAARQLRQSLLHYAAGPQFNPKHDLGIDLLQKILGAPENKPAQ